MPVYAKDPSSTVDFSIDWSDWLAADEQIVSAAWNIEPSLAGGLQAGQLIDAGSVRGVFVSGGSAGDRYRLTCHVVTDAGRSADRSLALRLMEL